MSDDVERGPMELAVIEWYGGEFSETDSELLQIAREQDERMLKLERDLDGFRHRVAELVNNVAEAERERDGLREALEEVCFKVDEAHVVAMKYYRNLLHPSADQEQQR